WTTTPKTWWPGSTPTSPTTSPRPSASMTPPRPKRSAAPPAATTCPWTRSSRYESSIPTSTADTASHHTLPCPPGHGHRAHPSSGEPTVLHYQPSRRWHAKTTAREKPVTKRKEHPHARFPVQQGHHVGPDHRSSVRHHHDQHGSHRWRGQRHS